jgi:hypothetical protein
MNFIRDTVIPPAHRALVAFRASVNPTGTTWSTTRSCDGSCAARDGHHTAPHPLRKGARLGGR